MPLKEFLQFGHSAYYKDLRQAKKSAKINKAKIKTTFHTLRGKGYLVYK